MIRQAIHHHYHQKPHNSSIPSSKKSNTPSTYPNVNYWFAVFVTYTIHYPTITPNDDYQIFPFLFNASSISTYPKFPCAVLKVVNPRFLM